MCLNTKLINLVISGEASFRVQSTLNGAVENKSFNRSYNHRSVPKLLDVLVFERVYTLFDTDKAYHFSRVFWRNMYSMLCLINKL